MTARGPFQELSNTTDTVGHRAPLRQLLEDAAGSVLKGHQMQLLPLCVIELCLWVCFVHCVSLNVSDEAQINADKQGYMSHIQQAYCSPGVLEVVAEVMKRLM